MPVSIAKSAVEEGDWYGEGAGEEVEHRNPAEEGRKHLKTSESCPVDLRLCLLLSLCILLCLRW